MKLIKIAACSVNQTPRDWKSNISNIIDGITLARDQHISLLCFQEMTIPSYGMEDDYFCLDVSRRSILKLKEIAQHTENMIVAVGLPIVFDNSLYNAVATIVNKRIVGFTCKSKLASDGVHYESRFFKPWHQGVTQTIEIPELEGEFLIGDIHYNIGGVKIGYEICECAWTSDRDGSRLAARGMDIILNPSASHFAFGKFEIRKRLVVDGSRAFNATYMYANAIGNEAGRLIYDAGNLIAQGGTLLAQGKRFTYQNVFLTTAIVDVHNTKTSQIRTASFQPDLEAYNKGCVSVKFNYPSVTEKITTEPEAIEAWEVSKDIKHEECTRALGLSLMDYMRKSHTKGFTISLSGGADSAMVTYLCAMGIRLGIKELGLFGFVQKYCPHIICGKEDADEEYIIGKLITTAYQATENSGEVTKTAAREIAKSLNVKHFEFDVQPVLKEYIKIAYLIKDNLNWKDDDITLQNLQARTRSPSIWIIANIEQKLLLTTSNMSEAAVGYATASGDLGGCIAPIAGLPKIYIREYLRYLEQTGNCMAMSFVNKQAPTAELRPSEYKQTDEDDLMPYWLLHRIEVLSMKNRYTPSEIYKCIKSEVDYDNNKLIKDITKFFTLFSRNQWKREQIPVSFHMDDHNLDPRSWSRLPILNSGYKEELEELQQFLEQK